MSVVLKSCSWECKCQPINVHILLNEFEEDVSNLDWPSCRTVRSGGIYIY